MFFIAFSRCITESSNLIKRVLPLCQCAVTLHGKPLWFKRASTIPPIKAAQFRELLSLGTDINLLTRGSFSIIKYVFSSSSARSSLSASLPNSDFQTVPFKKRSVLMSLFSRLGLKQRFQLWSREFWSLIGFVSLKRAIKFQWVNTVNRSDDISQSKTTIPNEPRK